jgi:hypothetical protein
MQRNCSVDGQPSLFPLAILDTDSAVGRGRRVSAMLRVLVPERGKGRRCVKATVSRQEGTIFVYRFCRCFGFTFDGVAFARSRHWNS